MTHRHHAFFALLLACSSPVDQAADPIDGCETCVDGKVDGLTLPEAGSCDADIIVRVANEMSFDELDIDAGLNIRAATNIVDARDGGDIASLSELDAVSYVGASAMMALLEYGQSRGIDCDSAPPADGTCGTQSVVRVANEATLEQLDDEAGLDSRAAQNLVDGRPYSTYDDVDAVSYVGASALEKLADFAESLGFSSACEARGEIGIISDLDRTVIPHHSEMRPDAPYPGVTTLYQILEFGADGNGEAGDFTFVTARTPDRVVDVPDWLELHGVPTGPIETGVSGIPWVAQDAKIEDVTRTFAAHPEQAFVLFGDTSHRDPEVYQAMLASHPDQVRAGMIHMVNQTVSDHRLVGLHLYHNYAECAAMLVGLDIIAEADAWRVYEDAKDEGLEMTEAEFGDLLDTHR